jgi:hypothetical protein
MPRASGKFFQAVAELRQAVEREFRDNKYYLLSNQVSELREILNRDNGPGAQATGIHHDFASTLDAVRMCAEAELFDDRFYLVAHKLDVLNFLGRRPYECANNNNGAMSHPNGQIGSAGALNGASIHRFEKLAATAKARRSYAGGSLNGSDSHSTATIRASQPKILAIGEVEGETPSHVADPGSVREPWKKWRPPAFLSKPLRRFPSPAVYRRVWDHRPLKPMLMEPPATVARMRPKKKPPRERFVLPRQRMIARPLQPAKR